jgi:hypothetical protein
MILDRKWCRSVHGRGREFAETWQKSRQMRAIFVHAKSVATSGGPMRVRAVLSLGALAILLAGCTHSVADQEDSTRDFSFDIVQVSYPPVIGSGSTRIDVPFEVTIGNKTDHAVTVERIALQSFEMGDYQIPFRSRPFEKVIAPGAKEKFEFWANAIVTDPLLGTKQPLTLRTMIDFTSAQGSRHEVFVRGINGRIGFGVQRPIG